MSPTSYQTAPPRTSIIVNDIDIVKLPTPRCRDRAQSSGADSDAGFHHWIRGSARLGLLIRRLYSSRKDRAPHPNARSRHRYCRRPFYLTENLRLLRSIGEYIRGQEGSLKSTRQRPRKGREEVPVQLSRLLDAHQVIIGHCRTLAERADKLGDAGTNDLAVSDVLRANELQVWFLSEHLVDAPLVKAEPTRLRDVS